MLRRDVIPFWAGLIDEDNGGYLLNHSSDGAWLGPGEKFLVTQARMLWFFATLARHGLVSRGSADHGYRFIRERMWDDHHGGFYWAVDHTGRRPTRADKHLFAQAYGLFALCAHAQATEDPRGIQMSQTLFALIEERARDHEHGGYREAFTADWSPPPPDRPGYMGTLPDRKLYNTHLHLLEALTALVDLAAPDSGRERLGELVTICSERVVDPRTGGCRDEHLADWTAVRGRRRDRASYGHDLENAALLLGATDTLGWGPEPVLDSCRSMCAHALAYGLDRVVGGFFFSGRLGRPADRSEKVWWTQAEAVHGLLRMWEATGEARYLDVMADTLTWIDSAQVDRAGGDWHETVSPKGVASGAKAGAWKDPYHQTRALLAVSALAPEPVRPGGA